MSRKRKTSRVPKRESKPGEINLRPTSRRIVWSRTQAHSGRFVRWGLFLLIVGTAIFLGGRALQNLFRESEEFALEEIELWKWESEEAPFLVDRKRLEEQAELVEGTSIFAFQLEELEAKIEALPEVSRVRVTRRLPNVIRVRVDELEPVAWVEAPQHRLRSGDYVRGLLVDGEGQCFAPSVCMAEKVQDLPVLYLGDHRLENLHAGGKVHNREFLRALRLVEVAKGSFYKAGWTLPVIALRNNYSLLAKTHTGASVIFGLYEHERQLEDLREVLDLARNTARGIERVNLIPKKNIPVVFVNAGDLPRTIPTALEGDLQTILTRG